MKTRSCRTLLIISIFQLSICKGGMNLYMYQDDPGDRSIGSYVTLYSVISNTSADEKGVAIQLYRNLEDPLALITYTDWTDLNPQPNTLDKSSNPNFTMSVEADEYLTRKISWRFNTLSSSDNGVAFITELQQRSITDNITLNILPCKSSVVVDTAGMGSNYTIIAANSSTNPGFNDLGTCSCLDNGTLFDASGVAANTTAKCGLKATWLGCNNFQCWKGPQNIIVEQTIYTVGESNVFNCTFVPGFPEYAERQLKIDEMTVKFDYTLQSSDNGKSVSCQVITNYTTAMGENATSNVKKVIVYYPPENSEVSQNDIVMLVNQSKAVNFSFSGNPVPGSGGISVNFSAEFGKILPSYEWGKNSSKGTLYNYELIINWSSDADYGVYNVCAKSFIPDGEDCSPLTIRNIPATTIVTTYTTPLFSDTTIESTDKAPNEEQNIGLIVGAAVAGIVALLLIIAVIYFVRRKHGKNSSNKKEERINEIYESTPNPGPSTETVYTVAGNSQAEMKTNEMYEASPQQPEIQDVYTTVNRDNKLKGKKEKDSSENAGSDSTSAEANGPAVADVYATVKK